MILTKIVFTNFHEKLRKLPFMFFSIIQTIKNIYKKPKKRSIFKYKGLII